MSTGLFLESDVEEAALDWLQAAGWTLYGADLPGDTGAERSNYSQVILEGRLREAIASLNPELPMEAVDDAFRRVTRLQGADTLSRNRDFHRLLVDGATVEYRTANGEIRGAQTKVIDFDDVWANDFLVANQFTVTEDNHNRRPDVVLFVNGVPLVVIELKNAADEKTGCEDAYLQLQTYKAEIPSLFDANEILVVSDGSYARVGSLTAGWEWFKPWRSFAAEGKAVPQAELHTVIEGVLTPERLLAMVRDFIVFEDDGGGAPVKKIAGYHQFHAVQVALEETLRAADGGDDHRVGVIWHTQGSGKSLTMAFYAGRIIREPAMQNPTIVVLTDRNDLDGQLFDNFSLWRELLRQPPVQAESRADLRKLLSVVAGGVVFTTIQKFFPEEKGGDYGTLSERRNIVVIADEAHRSQYDFIDGYARHIHDALPNAAFIGFTGTPIELRDANTRAVFGDYISIYDIQRSVADKATVPIYYESRLAKLAIDEAERPKIDPNFEELTENEELDHKERLKSRWAQLEVVVGDDHRLRLVAEDLVDHFEKRLEAMEGKAMVVCMSRRICMDLHDEIVKLRPDWFDEDDCKGQVKVVMTGNASEGPRVAAHARNKARRAALANRFRKPDDDFKLVMVRDMWLTGFDAPSLHTMYLDKPMQGHGLMQAIARVNRVFRDKPGGLVVDYLGIAAELREALATYTESGGEGEAALDQEQAVALMLEKYEICCGIFHGFDWSAWLTGTAGEKLDLPKPALNYVLGLQNGKERILKAVTELSQAFALAVPHEEALRIRDGVAFFQLVRGYLAKDNDPDGHGKRKTKRELDEAVRQIVSRAVISEQMVDIFSAAGLKKPEISMLSDEFLAEVKNMPQRNLAVELLQKLLKGEIRSRSRKNVVMARSFADMLEQTLRRYQNRAIEAAQVIEQLIQMAKELRELQERGVALDLTEDELAFYDALETNDSAVKVLGDETLRDIARELVASVRANVTIDWTMRESVRAEMRVIVKRILRKYGYPPDKAEKATQTVLEQAEVLSEEWVVSS